MVRVLWVVRHAEREDNINPKWRLDKNPRSLKSDNPPLSTRGQGQADELYHGFAKVHITHVFASPFDRTLETATRLIGSRGIPIKVEPGLAESLYLCESPPGFETIDVLKKLYPLIDTEYEPVFKPPLPTEGDWNDACCERLKRTVDTICQRYNKADESIMLVSHGNSIGAIHENLTGEWRYVGQATISKFVEDAEKPGKFNLEFSSDYSHLSDKVERPY